MFICKREKCTGCYACYNICPFSAIEMKGNEIGHHEPYVDEEKCTKCNLCKKICPNNSNIELSSIKCAFASYTLNIEDYNTTTSGGVATLFSKYILEKGGIVYGSAVCQRVNICHVRVDNILDIEKLKGSKYVQSKIGDIFRQVKEDLQNDKNVLFIGIPCQISGLKGYLQNEYSNLITIDLICHGVPSQQLLDAHIVNNIGRIEDVDVSFRDNNGFYLKLFQSKNVLYYKTAYKDLYYIGFLKALYYRESCYHCNYARKERISDITIGDFWGLGLLKTLKTKPHKGISVILSITTKGQRLIEECKEKLFLEQREIQEALNGNQQLNHPTNKHKNSELFKKLYVKNGFEKSAKRCLFYNIIKYRIFIILKKLGVIK